MLNEKSHRPLIFIACETGFAPIKSLIEHAMALDAAETLHLYWIAAGKGTTSTISAAPGATPWTTSATPH